MLLEQRQSFRRWSRLEMLDQLIERAKYLFERFAASGIDMAQALAQLHDNLVTHKGAVAVGCGAAKVLQ